MSPWVFAFSTQAQQSIVLDPKGPGSINSPHGAPGTGGPARTPRFWSSNTRPESKVAAAV